MSPTAAKASGGEVRSAARLMQKQGGGGDEDGGARREGAASEPPLARVGGGITASVPNGVYPAGRAWGRLRRACASSSGTESSALGERGLGSL